MNYYEKIINLLRAGANKMYNLKSLINFNRL